MAGRTCACHFTFKTFAFCYPLLLLLLSLLLLMLAALLFWVLFNFIVENKTETVKGVGVLRDLHLGGCASVHHFTSMMAAAAAAAAPAPAALTTCPCHMRI